MKNPLESISKATGFFDVRTNSVPSSLPLPYDLYLLVNAKPVLFRKRGDLLTEERVKLLRTHGGNVFLVPNDQRGLYLQSLKDIIKDPSTPTDLKAKMIKETAFIHVDDLFNKEHIAPVIEEARGLVEEMVSFVSTDVNAVVSLLRLSVHDYYTYNHCVDVAVYSILLAKKLFGDSPALLMKAGLGGLLHDIGKRKVRWDIINKTSPLSPEEWAEIKGHPTFGRDIVADIETIPIETKLVVYEHHENFDGTGYPQAIEGDEISKLARIVTIADVFDALTTDRSYHKAVTPNEALTTMFGMQPGKFDPNIFKFFNKNFEHKKPELLLPKDFDPCQPQKLSNYKKTG
jgi:HD-GYP domain-containing protein (c-di-GMP phosphodiesterase class II)